MDNVSLLRPLRGMSFDSSAPAPSDRTRYRWHDADRTPDVTISGQFAFFRYKVVPPWIEED